MRCLVCLASDAPLEPMPNPHLKLYSVNEALALGLRVPPVLLISKTVDRDKPGAVLWSDLSVETDAETGESGLPEDCWDIWPLKHVPRAQSEKHYFASVEWPRCTPGRAAVLIDYVRRLLEQTEEVELWNLWDGDDAEFVRVRRRTVSIGALTAEDILTLCSADPVHPTALGPLEVIIQYCLVITR